MLPALQLHSVPESCSQGRDGKGSGPCARGAFWFLLSHPASDLQHLYGLNSRLLALCMRLLAVSHHGLRTKSSEEWECDHQIHLIYSGFEPRSSG